MGFWKSTKEPIQNSAEGDSDMSDVKVIDFGDVLDISFAAKLHSQLKDETTSNSHVQFDASELTRIDASCLQVLTSYMSYAKENDIKIEWINPNDVIMDATRLTGLTEILELN